MKTIGIISNASATGKSTITFSILNLLYKKGIKICPFKPMSITNDVVDIGGGTIPWSLTMQLEQAHEQYKGYLNPILLEPIVEDLDIQDVLFMDKEYKLYKRGKYIENLYGKNIIQKIDILKEVICSAIYELEDKDIILIEGMGNAFSEYNLESLISNLIPLKLTDAQVILVIDVSRDSFYLQMIGTIAKCKENELDIIGVILTKYENKNNEHIASIEYLEKNRIKYLGSIPFNNEAIEMNTTFCDKWGVFVEQYIDVDYLIEAFTTQYSNISK